MSTERKALVQFIASALYERAEGPADFDAEAEEMLAGWLSPVEVRKREKKAWDEGHAAGASDEWATRDDEVSSCPYDDTPQSVLEVW